MKPVTLGSGQPIGLGAGGPEHRKQERAPALCAKFMSFAQNISQALIWLSHTRAESRYRKTALLWCKAVAIKPEEYVRTKDYLYLYRKAVIIPPAIKYV